MSQANGIVTSDPRIDKLITWALAAISAIALSVGGYFFKGLTTQMSEVNETLNKIGIRVEVNSKAAEVSSREIDRLRNTVDNLLQRVAVAEAKIKD